jgi:hypothetical protein
MSDIATDELSKEQRMRANVVAELVATEGNYLRDLGVLQKLFIDPVRTKRKRKRPLCVCDSHSISISLYLSYKPTNSS